jgi:hypothetical protein
MATIFCDVVVAPPSNQPSAFIPADGKRGLDEDDRRLEVCHDFKMGKCNVCGLLCATLHWHVNEIPWEGSQNMLQSASCARLRCA